MSENIYCFVNVFQLNCKNAKMLSLGFLNLPSLTTNNWPEAGSSRPSKLDIEGKERRKIDARTKHVLFQRQSGGTIF